MQKSGKILGSSEKDLKDALLQYYYYYSRDTALPSPKSLSQLGSISSRKLFFFALAVSPPFLAGKYLNSTYLLEHNSHCPHLGAEMDLKAQFLTTFAYIVLVDGTKSHSPEQRRGKVDDLDVAESERQRVDDHPDEGEEVHQERGQPEYGGNEQGFHSITRKLMSTYRSPNPVYLRNYWPNMHRNSIERRRIGLAGILRPTSFSMRPYRSSSSLCYPPIWLIDDMAEMYWYSAHVFTEQCGRAGSAATPSPRAHLHWPKRFLTIIC